MSARSRASLVLWLVIALALVAIVARLVSRETAEVEPIEAPAHATPAPSESATDLRPPSEGVLADAIAPPPSKPPPRAVPLVVSAEPGDAGVHGFVLPIAGETSIGRNVRVSWTDRAGTVRWTDVAEDGSYSAGGLRAGTYWFRASAHLGGIASAEVELAGERRLDLRLRPRPEVRVRLVDPSGAPIDALPRCIAIATAEPPGRWIDEVRGSANNTFGVGRFHGAWEPFETLPTDYLGRIELDAEPPLHVSLVAYQYVIATQTVEPGQREVSFVLERAAAAPKGRLRVRFVDAVTREPLKKGGIRVDGRAHMTSGVNPEAPYESSLEPGSYVVHLHAKDYGDPAIAVRIEPDVDTDLGEVLVEGALSISGRVLDEKGEPAAHDVIYDVCDESGRARRWTGGVLAVRAGRDGAFRIPGLGAGRYRLTVLPDGRSSRARRFVELRGGPVEDVELRLETTTPLLVHVTGDAWSVARLRIVDAAGEERYEARVERPEPYPIPLVRGRYTVEYRASPAADPVVVPIDVGDVALALTLP